MDLPGLRATYFWKLSSELCSEIEKFRTFAWKRLMVEISETVQLAIPESYSPHPVPYRLFHREIRWEWDKIVSYHHYRNLAPHPCEDFCPEDSVLLSEALGSDFYTTWYLKTSSPLSIGLNTSSSKYIGYILCEKHSSTPNCNWEYKMYGK